jgi:hypothetical protein
LWHHYFPVVYVEAYMRMTGVDKGLSDSSINPCHCISSSISPTSSVLPRGVTSGIKLRWQATVARLVQFTCRLKPQSFFFPCQNVMRTS